MNNYVLITGASTGIGYELAKVAAKDGFNLIIIARNQSKLEEAKTEIEKEFSVKVQVITADLSDPQSSKNIFDIVEKNQWQVDVLINNAGFANNGRFDQIDWQKEANQIQVNVATLVEMCHLFIPKMIQNKTGKILNVASIAGYLPGPFMATYYATKAFVKSFSIAINEELKDQGVSVSVLCPGPTKTEFFTRAKFNPEAPMMTAQKVAQIGWSGLLKEKPVIVAGVLNSILVAIVAHLPQTFLAWATTGFNKGIPVGK
ncbi:MAG: SDR family oxidoreductase [bacterium]